jgi:hypothetical protein
VGEPLLTGWGQRQAAALATRAGLNVVSDVGPAELTARYLIGSDGQPDGMMVEFPRIVHVRVPSRTGPRLVTRGAPPSRDYVAPERPIRPRAAGRRAAGP